MGRFYMNFQKGVIVIIYYGQLVEKSKKYYEFEVLSEETIKEIGRYAAKSSKARDSWRGSKSYREHLIEVLTQRAIKEAIKRNGGNQNE